MKIPSEASLERVYGDAAEETRARYEKLTTRFESLYGANHEPTFFSAPGRTEIIGNHTDHNGGKILAASITMDTIGAAAANGTNTVHVSSEGYPTITIHLSDLDSVPHSVGSVSLLAGMFKAVREFGHTVGGFDATVSSQVIPAAGVSSSASFEMLICAMVDHLFNGGEMDLVTYARIGQYAENKYWEKASGLMDQMACAVGGTILLDFSSGVTYERLDFSYDQLGCDLVLVNTGKGHADLSAEYSSVPDEMHAVARKLGVANLCESTEDKLIEQLAAIRTAVGDRASMRALHYFEECARVEDAAAALSKGDRAHVLELITESGNSSWKWLQNAYVTGETREQPIPVALALTELFLKGADGGACRLHGGGFAGVIMCAVPKSCTNDYVMLMSDAFGRENVYLTNIRAAGAVRLDS